MLAASKFPNKMSRYQPTLHDAERLQQWFPLFPSLLLCHPSAPTVLPYDQSVVPTWNPLAVNRMELLAGCAPVQSLKFVIPWRLWLPNSPFVSTQSTLPRQSRFPPRRLGTLRTHRVATEHLSWRDEQSFISPCSLYYYVLITGRASRT